MSPRRRALALALVALAVALALLGARRALAAWMIGDGVGATQRPLRPGPAVPPPPRAPLRVIVLDGLTAADATTPALAALCARGVDLTIDVGFPTKSLPVQAVLWTGLTAQQLGLGPSNRRRALPPGALPALVPGSIAVVESWTRIAGSMGFARVEPAARADAAEPDADADAVAAWATEFPRAARAAVASTAPLVLVHVLAIDRAAHAGGRGTEAYRRARADADALVATLIARRPDATWLVLSDHGHRAGGGHGDAEPAVRYVRGCVTPTPPGAARRGAVHLVDLARHLRDVAGQPPRPGAVGRPLAAALAAPDPDATLPRPGRARWLLAGLLLVIGGGLAIARARPRWSVAWLPLAIAADLAWRGAPTLSARDPRAAIVCAVLAAVPALVLARRDRRALGAIAITCATAVAMAAVLAGVPTALVDGRPPARPYVTAVLELVAAAMAAVAWLTLAVGLLMSATPDARAGRRR
ncbi:MAG: hypothetical protein IPL61_18870 [Myxococcales bacterium]|nr:hypothetical protein [Myxococcales bacterium]